MSTAVAELPMPKTNKPRRDDKAVKIERGIAEKAGFIADRLKIPVAEFLSKILRDPVDREWVKHLREVDRRKDGD